MNTTPTVIVNRTAPDDAASPIVIRTHAKEHPMSSIAPLHPPAPDEEGPPDEPPAGRARCADGNGTMVGLFFSDHIVDIARAKAMCALCPQRAACLAGALEREEPWGVWGGELLSGGRVIADKRPCGRPPKHPRPEIVYDEMGPVGAALTVA